MKLPKKQKFSEFWHLEVLFIIPVILLWSALLIGIYLKV